MKGFLKNRGMIMARKKQVRDVKKKTGPLGTVYYEVGGLGLIVLSVVMLGELGLIGQVTKRIAILLVGEFFWILGLIAIYQGGRMMIARKGPRLISPRQVGIYLVAVSLLVFSHLPVYHLFYQNRIPLLGGIWAYYWSGELLAPGFMAGGGIAGGLLYALFVPLITWFGLFGLAVITLAYGLLVAFGLTIRDAYENSRKRREKVVSAAKKKQLDRAAAKQLAKDEEVKNETEYLLNNKVVTPHVEKAYREEKKATAKKQPLVPALAKGKDSLRIKDFEQLIEQDTEPQAPEFAGFDAAAQEEGIDYALPPYDLLIDHPQTGNSQKMMASAKAQAEKLEETFTNFDVRATIQDVQMGPSVTRFEVIPDSGVKVSKIVNLSNDIALSLAAKGIRMEAPIPGKSAIGIEVPNPEQKLVTFKEILKDIPASRQREKLLMALGRDIAGSTVSSTLNTMPHLLVAGATGSGKSVCINTMICSILMRATPQEVKMLLIDPKKVELNRYNGLPHLLAPVVTDARLASLALKKVVAEMEHRYELFSDAGVRNIESYNDYITQQNLDAESPKAKLSLVVVIVDELADLMMVASKEVEECIMRLTQMARAAGIHLVIATQRPSVDVITGVIKANVPSRIAFGVSSAVDSRTILDCTGAEKLLGKGDMLFLPMGSSNPVRVQGAFISDDEVTRVVEFIKNQVPMAEEKMDFLENLETGASRDDLMEDPLMREVLAFVLETKKASASFLQRRFKIGYNRAARLVEQLEAQGVISPSDGNKAREVIMTEEQYRELIG